MKQRELKFMIYEGQYLVAYISLPDTKIRERTGIVIKKEAFDKGQIPSHVQNKMHRLKYVVSQYIMNCYNGDVEVDSNEVRNIIRKEVRKKEQAQKVDTVLELFTRYCEAIKSGDINNKGKTYSYAITKTNNAILGQLEECKAIAGKDVNKLSLNDIQLFNKHLISKGKTQNTISVYINQFVFFLERTHGYKWHSNTIYKEAEFVPGEVVDYHIALSEKEIADIYNADIDKNLVPYRDLFVFGCYTGLRVSDLTGSIDIKGFNDNILTVGTRKTGKVVHIPINKIAKEIWDKYKGKLPKSYPSKIIDIVQDVAKSVGINQEVLFTRTEGGKKVKEYFKKYELIGMHTARRSFATNAYKSGVPHQTIMNLTSHKTYESFIRYLRLGGTEHAEIAQKNEFFK